MMKCKREIIDVVKLLQKLGPRADSDFQSLIDLRKGSKVVWYQCWYRQICKLSFWYWIVKVDWCISPEILRQCSHW